jgi:Uma2 family endonuclease
MDGSPDLVVEVLSPESIGRDRGDKYREYEAAGIPEYWLLDPERQMAEFYRLGENGRYALHQIDSNNRYQTPTIPGFWLQIEWLWQMPPTLDVLRQLELL